VHEQPDATEEEQEQAPQRIPVEEPDRDERTPDADEPEEPTDDA
jgi:hypothetical protein